MEKIIREYGGFLLSGFALIALIFMIFFGIRDDAGNQGALNMIGARIRTESTDYISYTDFDSLVADAGSEKPVIDYIGNNDLHTGHLVLSDYIQATSSTGDALPIKVLAVVDPIGVELSCDENSGVNCTTPGIYTVTVSAVDGINKKTVNIIRIPIGH